MADEGRTQEQAQDQTTEPVDEPRLDATDYATLNPAEQTERVFAILKGALVNADLEYDKSKDPDTREHGRESVEMMERAFIHASRHDQARASDLYAKTLKTEVPADLLARAAKQAGNATDPKELNDLAVGINRLGEQRHHHGQKAMAQDLKGKIREGEVAIGDKEARAIDHRRRANDQLMTGMDGKHRDDGLHLFQAFQSGMRAGHEYHNMGRERKKAKEMAFDHMELKDKQNLVIGEIRKFTPGQTDDRGGPTSGPMGDAVARNPSVFQRTAAAMARRAPAYQAAPAAAAASSMAARAMAAAKAMGTGPGIGG